MATTHGSGVTLLVPGILLPLQQLALLDPLAQLEQQVTQEQLGLRVQLVPLGTLVQQE